MQKLCIAAVECNYQEIDWQLKGKFIHSLNNKHKLEEFIKELTATNNDDHIISGGVLAWAKRLEVQRVQAAVLDMLTGLRQFNKVQISKKPKEDNARAPVGQILQQQPCQYCGGLHVLRQCLVYGKTCGLWQDQTLQEGMPQQKKEGGKQDRSRDIPRIQQRQN